MGRHLIPGPCLARTLLLLASIPAIALSRPSDSDDVPFCRVIDSRVEPGLWAAKPAAVKAEDPRTVRLIYFRPNDGPFRAEVVDSMKAAILRIQAFYADEMERHGHGNLTFQFETDERGEPLVHRVDGEHGDAHYLERSGARREIWRALGRNPMELVVLDLSANTVPYFSGGAGGVTWRNMEGDRTVAATVLVPSGFSWSTVAHELGHAFDLEHDFSDSEYIMSYGANRARLSACAAEFLAVHPSLNPGIGVAQEASPVSVDLISPPGYAAGSTSTPIRIEIGNSTGLHQVLLFATTELPHFAAGSAEVKVCRSLAGERTATVEFDYDGVIPSRATSSLADPIVHWMRFLAVDTAGRTTRLGFSLFQLSELHMATLEEPGSVISLAFAPGGSLASAGGDTLVKLWDPGTRETIASFGPASHARAVAISPDGATLASEHDGTVKLWEVATGTNTGTLEGMPGHHRFRSVAFSPPDGKSLAVVSGDSTVKLWDLATATNYADLDHDSHVRSIAYSPDGKSLASTSEEAVTLWNPVTGERTAVLEGHVAWVGAVAFSPDGATLASQSGWDGLVRIWDVETRRTVASIENARGGSAMAFSPDGATLACASGPLVKLWDLGTRVRIDSLAHRDLVHAIAFSPDGGTLATGTWKGVEVWDASGWQLPRPHALVEISGGGQQGSPGAPLENPLVVEVLDQHGNGMAGVPVAFTVVEGDGRLGSRFTVESTETDDDGRAAAALTLGIVPGTTTVEATLLRADPVVFEAIAVEAPIPPGESDLHKWHLPDRASVRLGRGSIEAALATRSVPLAFSPDGRRLAVAASIGTWMYDAATARAIDLLTGTWISSAAFSPDGTVAAGSRDGTVVLWDAAGGESTTLYRHLGEVHSVAFSPDGTLLASHNGSSIRLWDVADGRELWSVASDASGPLAFSPDGATLTLTGRNAVRLWDVASADPVTTLSAPALDDESEVLSVALSPDGATLAIGSWSALKLWDIAQDRERATLVGHAGGIGSLAFSSDGARLASGSYDRTARVWDAATGGSAATFDLSTSVEAVAFSPDGRTLASVSWDEILLWDIETRSASRIRGHASTTSSSALSPDGATVAVGSVNSTRLVDVRTGKDTATLRSKAQVNAVTFSRDGSILAVGARSVTLWDVAATRTISTLEGPDSDVQSLAFSPDGATLAAGYWNGHIRLWDVAEGGSIALLAGHTSLVNSVAFSPDGVILASGSWDSTARLWDLEANREITALEGYFGEGSVAFSPDGATLAVASPTGIRLLEPKTWKETNFLGGSGVHSLAFSPDGTTLAAGTRDGTVVLWDTTTHRRVATHEGHTADVRSLAFSRDGITLASRSRDGTVLLWDLSPRPHVLGIVSGDGQEGEPGSLLPGTLVVEVRDENGDLLEGAQVTFTVTGGDGALSTALTTTDSRGRAATTLTLGSRPGPNTVEAVVEGLEATLFTATAEATPDFDGDGEVGFGDFFLFAEAFGGTDPRFDLDGSGTVDFADFFLFAESFGQPARAKLMALAREMIGLPEGPQLQQNWPNPFNSGTVISWFLLQPGPARLEVFALNGQRVAVLSRGHHEAGLHRLQWDGRDDRGRPLASGTYLYRLVTAEEVSARKFVLIR